MKKYIIISILTFSFFEIFSQNTSTTIRENVFVLNPARTGSINSFHTNSYDGKEVNAHFSNFWSGYKTANTIANASFHSHLASKESTYSKMGLGINVNNEQVHILNKTRLTASYSYRYKFKYNELNRLSFGFNTSFLNQFANTSRANVKNIDDPSLLNGEFNGNFFNIGSGANFFHQSKSEKHALSIDFAANDLLNSRYNKTNQTGNFLNRNNGGVSPSLFMQVNYVLVSRRKYEAFKESAEKKSYEDVSKKVKSLGYKTDEILNSDLSDSTKLYLIDSLKTNLLETDDNFTKAKAKILEEEINKSSMYIFNPYFTTLNQFNLPWEFHFGFRHSFKPKKMKTQILFGNGFIFQTSNNFDLISGSRFSFNTFLGFKFNNKFSFIMDMDNNINTFNRVNDVYRLGTTVFYQF